MTVQNAEYSFDVSEVPGGYEVTYEKTKYGWGKSGCLIVTAAIIVTLGTLFIVALITDGRPLSRTAAWIVLATPFIVSLIFFPRMMNRKRLVPGEFRITHSHIGVDGKEYSRSDISKIFIADKTGDVSASTDATGDGVMLGGTGAAGFGLAAATALANSALAASNQYGQLLGSSFARVAVRIMFTFGEKDIVLASGLDSRRAESLYNKVIELLKQTQG